MHTITLSAILSLAVLANGFTHAVTGTVKKVDSGTKTVVVKTADGTEHTFKTVGKAIASGAKAGEHVVVHYSEEGGVKTAHAVKSIGSATPKVAKGVVTDVGKGGKTVAVKTEDGSTKVFHVAKGAVYDSGKGIAKGTKAVGKGVSKGAEVTVHYSEEGGKAVAHVVSKPF